GHPDDRPEECSADELRQWIAATKSRAEQFAWLPDGDLVLEFRDRMEDCRLVPDATITALRRPLRVFVELDRSRKSLSRIEANLQRYATFFRRLYTEHYPDQKVPWLVYVVRSELRGENIRTRSGRLLGRSCNWKVLVSERDAVPWLAS